jgi:dephospho-CoA kinase
MTIAVAVTGGIGAGKSTIAGLLAARGAVVVDSDRLAREVVAPGTPGLAAVAETFGSKVIAKDGSLNRPILADIVFKDSSARKQLEAITHPLVRAKFRELRAAAPRGSVVVNDIPLLTTLETAGSFHLVIGVGAPPAVRIRRLIDRGLTASDAKARMDAQIDDERRRRLCDVWIDNSGTPADARKRVELIWARLREFAANVDAGRVAARGGPVLIEHHQDWPAAAARLTARIHSAVGNCRVDHIGSTAVQDLPATDVIDLQLVVPDDATAIGFEPLLAAAGFPNWPGFTQDTPQPGGGDPADRTEWRKRLHGNADPGRAVNLYVRTISSPGWVWALRFRDWLRADEAGRADYLAANRAAASEHAGVSQTAGYAEAKNDIFAEANVRSRAWAGATGWRPD